MSTTFIITARRVDENRQFDGDLRIKYGCIAPIGDGLAAHDGELMVDTACRRLEFNQ